MTPASRKMFLKGGDAKMTENAQQGTIFEIPPEHFEILYSDITVILASLMGFTFEFGQNTPQIRKVRIVSRVGTSPQHAKALHKVLGDKIAEWEKNFGPINLPGGPTETQKIQEDRERGEVGFKIPEN